MKVVLAASALPGIRAAQSANIAYESWSQLRPTDTIDVLPVSDGIAMPYVGSGLDDVFSFGRDVESIELGHPHERHFALSAGSALLIDYTDLLAGTLGAPGISSAVIGEDLAWAVARNYRDIYIALPQFSATADLGIELLKAYGHATLSPSGGDPESQSLTELIRVARTSLGRLSLTVLAPAEQRLLGLAGIARTQVREGLSLQKAQEIETALGARLDDILTAALEAGEYPRPEVLVVDQRSNTQAPSRRSLHERYARAPYAGIGSGIALMLDLLGARVFPVGDFTVRNRLNIHDADLVVYISGHIGEDLPSGLLTTIDMANKVGVPVVLIYDSGALRRGELPNLGLNGAYELRPHRAFVHDDDDDEELASLVSRLRGTVERVARTWGWD